MKLRELFSTIYTIIIILLIILSINAIIMYHNNNILVQSNNTRYKSYVIAEELRKSSDDLTIYCRTYVETGDSLWEKKYWEVLDIRNGKKTRPDGQTISLQDSMTKLDFTATEFAKLKDAGQKSNKLVWTENKAFQALKGLFADNTGRFTIKGTPDTLLARRIMFGKNYLLEKQSITKPIDDCIKMVVQRTHNEVEKYTKLNNWLLFIIIVLILIISTISIISYFLINKKIILQLEELKKSKEKAESSEEKFRFLFEKSPDVIIITSLTGDFLDCNQATLSFHHVGSLEELQKSKTYETFVNLDDRIEFLEELQKNGFARNKEIKFKSLYSNNVIDSLVSSELIRLKENEPVVISWIRDITEKENAENYVRKLSTAVSQNPAAILITDLFGKIEYINPQFTEITGYSFDEAMGKTAKILKSGFHSLEYYKNMWRTISSGKVWRGELYNVRKDGSFFWEDATLAPISNKKNEIINYIAIKQDITARKEAEFALIESEKQLKELNATKDQLFSIIGHDLRGPIAGLRTFLELMLSDFDLKDTYKLTTSLELLHSSANTTYDLLENLLLWAKTQQNEVVFNPSNVNLNEIAETSISLLTEVAKLKNISIHNLIPRDQIVFADKNMIMTVLRNLIMNGLKFTNKNKNIFLSISDGELYFTISVKDEGIGIKPESIKKLFNPKETFTNFGTAGEKGTGLGLLICHEFVGKHEGKIWVDSEEGKGSEFKFTIPKSKPE